MVAEVEELQELLAEGNGSDYSDSEPGDELRSSVDEAHRLAKLALQMSSNKKKGLAWSVSTRGGVASSAEKRMDLDRLVEFLNQVSAAPCRIPEAELLQVRDTMRLVGYLFLFLLTGSKISSAYCVY